MRPQAAASGFLKGDLAYSSDSTRIRPHPLQRMRARAHSIDSLLVADALVGLVADVHDATGVGIALDVRAVRVLELAATLDGTDAVTLSCVLGHDDSPPFGGLVRSVIQVQCPYPGLVTVAVFTTSMWIRGPLRFTCTSAAAVKGPSTVTSWSV